MCSWACSTAQTQTVLPTSTHIQYKSSEKECGNGARKRAGRLYVHTGSPAHLTNQSTNQLVTYICSHTHAVASRVEIRYANGLPGLVDLIASEFREIQVNALQAVILCADDRMSTL